MSYELLSFLSVSWSDAFSAFAMAFSVAALLGALRVSKEIKRKVDAELGELAPNFALFPAASPVPAQEGTRTLELRIDNYNRRPIRVTGLRVDRPAKVGLIAYHLTDSQDRLLGDMNRRHNEVFTSLVLEGTPPGASDFNSARLKLVLSGQRLGQHPKNPCKLDIRVDYELLQDAPEKHSSTVSLELRTISTPKERSLPPTASQTSALATPGSRVRVSPNGTRAAESAASRKRSVTTMDPRKRPALAARRQTVRLVFLNPPDITA